MPTPKGRNGNHKAPTFTLECGQVLELKKIPLLLYQRYEYEYRRDHPEPQPPVVELDSEQSQTLSGHPAYLAQKAIWDGLFQGAILEWVLGIGIVTTPPPEWHNDTGVFKNNPRLAWLYSIISVQTDEQSGELERLSEAIVGLSIATEASIAEAQKN